MKLKKFLSALFGLLFVLSLTATAVLAVSARDAEPVLVGTGASAKIRTELLMEALCAGDMATVSACLSGQPELKTGENETALSQVLWSAYRDSLSYAFSGGCYVSESGLSRDVTVTHLDIPAVLEAIQEVSGPLLRQRAAAAATSAYGDDGSYREAFVMQVLAEAAQQLLSENTYETQRQLTLDLSCREGQWLVRLDPALTDVLSGGMGG